MSDPDIQNLDPETIQSFTGGDSVLVLSSLFSNQWPMACSEFLSSDDETEVAVLCLTITRSPATHVTNWKSHGVLPARAAFIDVAGESQSSFEATTDTGVRATVADADIETTVEQVASPANLTQLGIQLTSCLDSLPGADADAKLVVCFDSITALLQYVDVEQAFKFLYILTDRFSDANALAHFHLDPDAHADETVNTLLPLFDAAVQ
jgi:hypothetical protein